MSTDIRIEDCGTIVLFTPVSEAGKAWMDENVQAESWQWLGGGLGVDHRCASSLVQGIDDAGLVLGE